MNDLNGPAGAKPMSERKPFNPLLLLPLVVFAGFGLLFWLALTRTNPDELPSALIGQRAPALTLEPLLDSQPVPTAADLDAPGIKLVNFWASWCAPCRAEHPILMQIAASGVPIYGINYKDIAPNARRFLDRLGNPFTKIGADSGRSALDWGLYGVPETFVIDGEGKVLLRYPGPVTERVYAERIKPLLEAVE